MGMGEAAALIAAALWAFSSTLYTRIHLSAWELNLSKILIAAGILAVQLAVVTQVNGEPMLQATANAWMWLAFSGVVGLVIGDTFYFRCLQILGVRRCLMISTTAPIFTAVFGLFIPGEVLTHVAIAGVFVTVIGIGLVVADRSTKEDEPGLFPGSLRNGIIAGLGASLCQAIGAVAARHGMKECGALEATFARLGSAAVIGLVVVLISRRLKPLLKQLSQPNFLKQLMPAVVCGTWLGVWLSQIAFLKIKAATAQTLLSTSPLFILLLTWAMTGKPPTRQVMLGAVVAVIGVFLIVS